MSLDRPIFIIGTGRCGSTIFHEVFTHHPQVAFLSGLCRKYPRQPQLNRWAMQLLDVPLLGRFARKKFRPAENWPFWDEYCRVFSAPCRDLLDSDVSPLWQARIVRGLTQLVTARRRRLLVKLTGWPRTGFLRKIFPDALFIHIVRDGRAVAHSLMNADFWRGHLGPYRWRWGRLTSQQRDVWERSGKSFWTLAGMQWNILMDSFELARARLPSDRYMEFKYEDFAADPRAVFRDVLSFCSLDHSRKFDAAIDSFDIECANFKWSEELNGFQRRQLEDVMGDRLVRWGYAPSNVAGESDSGSNSGQPTDTNAWNDAAGCSDPAADADGSSSELEYVPHGPV